MVLSIVTVALVAFFATQLPPGFLPALNSLSGVVHLGTLSTPSGLVLVDPLPHVLPSDVCPSLWPIQLHEPYPVTTLHDAARMIFLLEVSPKVSSIPQTRDDACPNLLPIQRHVVNPSTTLNDVAAFVDHALEVEKARSHTPPDSLAQIPNILSIAILSLIWSSYVLAALVVWSLHYSCKFLYGKEYLHLNRHQRRRLVHQLRRQQRLEHVNRTISVNQYHWFVNNKNETIAEYQEELRTITTENGEPSDHMVTEPAFKLDIAEKARAIVQLQEEADQFRTMVQNQENQISSLGLQLEQKIQHIRSNEKQLDCQSIIIAHTILQWNDAQTVQHATIVEIQRINKDLSEKVSDTQNAQSLLEKDLAMKRASITQLDVQVDHLNDKNRELENNLTQLKAMHDTDLATIGSLKAQIALLTQKSNRDEAEIARLNTLTTLQGPSSTPAHPNGTAPDVGHLASCQFDKVVQANGADDQVKLELRLLSPPTTPETSHSTSLPDCTSFSPVAISPSLDASPPTSPSPPHLEPPSVGSSRSSNIPLANVQLGERSGEFAVKERAETSPTPMARVDNPWGDKPRGLDASIWAPKNAGLANIASPSSKGVPSALNDNSAPAPAPSTPKGNIFNDGKPRGLNDSIWAPKPGQSRSLQPQQPSSNNSTKSYGGWQKYPQSSGASRDTKRDDYRSSRPKHRYTEEYGPHFNTPKRRGPQVEYNLHDIR